MINTSVSTIKIAGEFCKFYEDQDKQKYLGIKINAKNSQFFQYEIDGRLEAQKFRQLHSRSKDIGYFYYDKKNKTLPELQNEIRLMKEEKIQQCVESIMQQLIQSLFQLHSNGLMGRVINYENIIISEQGKVLLYDFGFCTDVPNNPQQNEYDLKLDVWLLGNILYYLIKGKEADFKDGTQIVLYTDKRIDKNFIDLINQMLLNDKNQRIDFVQIIKYLKNLPLQANLIEFYEKRVQAIEGKIKDRILYREITSQIMPPDSGVQNNLYSNVVIGQKLVSDVQVNNFKVDENLKKQINDLLLYYFTPEQIQDYNNNNLNEKVRIQKLYKILKDQYDQETREGKLHLFEILIMLKYLQFPGNQVWQGFNNLQQLRNLARDDQKYILDING